MTVEAGEGGPDSDPLCTVSISGFDMVAAETAARASVASFGGGVLGGVGGVLGLVGTAAVGADVGGDVGVDEATSGEVGEKGVTKGACAVVGGLWMIRDDPRMCDRFRCGFNDVS